MRRPLLAALAATIAFALQVRQAHADFTVTVGSATITEGDTGFVDVMIRSDGASALPLASAGFTFNITATNNANTLEFISLQPQDQSAPPTAAYLTSYLVDPNYVFFGNSSDFDNKTAVGNVTSTLTGTNDQYDGGDSTFLNNGADLFVPTTDVLLIRLSLTAALGSMPVAGDTFTIALTPSSTAFQTRADLDSGFREPYTPISGTVTISARSVPEPGSLMLIAFGFPTVGWVLRRRKFCAASPG